MDSECMGDHKGMKVDGLNICAWSENDEHGRFKRMLLQVGQFPNEGYGNLQFRVRVTCNVE